MRGFSTLARDPSKQKDQVVFNLTVAEEKGENLECRERQRERDGEAR